MESYYIISNIKYRNEDLNSLKTTVLISLMCFLPQSQQLLEEYFYPKDDKLQLQLSQRPKIAKEYFRIRSKNEFNPINFDQNISIDINQLIRLIASNQDRQILLQEVSLFNKKVWKLRMNAMPTIGICIISNEIKQKFMNKTLINMIKKNCMDQSDQNLQTIHLLFMNHLKFKKIDNVGPYDLPHSVIFKNEISINQIYKKQLMKQQTNLNFHFNFKQIGTFLYDSIKKQQLQDQQQQQLKLSFTGLILLCCNTILSVDDEVFNQKSLQLLLGQQGINFDILFNGRQAIEKVQNPTKCFSSCVGQKMILMDCQRPIMDGWKTTQKLREMMQNQQIPKVPIISLTAFTRNEDVEYILHKPLYIQISLISLN
ncbi:unnamed protein product [Paramecium sonneborni]|uniref:Response regulatory domain-containing protein n=1 Tax=Paramecium sonneborni TaxID=65129 RepID=A0A8S1PWE4_9CILI|nr:unnamed protein product [Paramecium sonneborni]